MPEQTHIIHHAAITITSNAWMDYGPTKQWVQHHLLELVDEVFSEMCDANTWLSVDSLQLEIDTGFHLPHLPADAMKRQIRSQIEQALQKGIRQMEPSGYQQSASMCLASLIDYLHQGTFNNKQGIITLVQWLEQPNAVSALSANQRQQLLQVIQQHDSFIRFKQLVQDDLQLKEILPSIQFEGLAFPQAWYDLYDALALPPGNQRDLFWLAAVQSVMHLPNETVPFFLQQLVSVGIDLKILNAALPPSWQQAMANLTSSSGKKQNHIAVGTDGKVANNAAPAYRNTGDSIYAANAGMVLLTPFLPQLFTYLNLNPLKNKDSAAAVLLIHFLASGNLHAEDWELVLPKLLCAYPIEQAVNQTFELPQNWIDAANELLQAAIAHWDKLGNTSPDGLRHSFLQRDGQLVFNDNNLTLKIAERTEDILLQFVPWNFRLIKLPWMHQLLQVDWA